MILFLIILKQNQKMSSKSQKHHRRRQNRVIFPHPLVKSLQPIQISSYSQSPTPPSYLPLHPSSYPSLIFKATHTHPVNNTKFSIILHPLIPDLPIPQYSQIDQCSQCQSVLTYHTTNSQYQCRLCSKPASNIHPDLIHCEIFDVVEGLNVKKQPLKKKTLLMMEANQYLYICSVHTIVRMLLFEMRNQTNQQKSFHQQQKDIHQQYGFAFFNETHVFVLNLDTNQLCAFKPDQFLGQQLPFEIQSVVKPQDEIDFEALEQISDYVMYESFKKKSSCLQTVIQMSERLYNQFSVETICMVHNLPEIKSQSYHQSISLYVFNKRLKDNESISKENLLSKNIKKHKKQSKAQGNLWKHNIKKIYSHENPDIHDFHYALHQHITKYSYYAVSSTIKSSSKSLIPIHPHLRIPELSSQSQILIDFDVQIKNQSCHQHAIDIVYIQCRFVEAKRSWRRIFVFKIPEIIKEQKLEPSLINDENFFFASVLRSLKSMKNQNLQQKSAESIILEDVTADVKNILGKLVDSKFIKNSEECSLPSNIFHTLIYLYLLTKQPVSFFLAIEQENLEFMAKQLYPKIYQVSELATKPMKFIQNTFQFEHNPLLVIDDGSYVSLVLSEPHSHHYHYNQFLELYFGTNKIEQIVVMDEIPELETGLNKKLRRVINLLREYSKFRFLPIKIVMADSQEFEERFGRTYIEKEHFSYIHSLLKSIFCS